jgi:hypothetical protein
MKFITHSFTKTLGRRLALLGGALAVTITSNAQNQVFFENWETDHSFDNTYVTNSTAGGVNLANLYFDYSTVGVPLSPHSAGGGTHALKMCANLVSNVFGGVSVSPVGFGITENFEMRFDAWFNFNGPLPGGGNGSTQVGGAGYGTAGTNAQTAGVADSVFIGATADGGSSADYRVYSPGHAISYQDGAYRIGSSGTDPLVLGDPSTGYVYAGTNRNSSPNGYYTSNFPGQQCPTNQFLIYSQQTNSNGTLPGAPGFASAGSQAFKWHDVSLKKIANVITYSIDGVLIATVDVVDAGTLGGTNILFNHYDINAGASTDPNRTNLIFTLVDNVRITNFPNVVSVINTVNSITEGDTSPGTFVIQRTSSGVPLTVTYTMTGTATNGVDYTNSTGGPLSGSVNFAPNATSTNINVYIVDDAIPELTETITLNIDPSPNYTGAGNATIRIIDNDPPVLTITNLSTQMFERTNDYARFQITRLGATNSASFSINLSFSGTATFGVDYYTNVLLTFDPGVSTTNINILPIEDLVYEGSETATVSIAPASAGEYTIGSPSSASITIVDANNPPETVLFADNFDVDSSANWTVAFADTNSPPVTDFTAQFAFDYSSQSIPPAPHGNGSTVGLFLTVNKDPNTAPVAAALNLYPIGQNFSGNYAIRCDMWLNIVPGLGNTTEYALLGLNHSGTKTNWWRSGGVPAGWTFDGVFYEIETDSQANTNYQNFSSPTLATPPNPTSLSVGTNAIGFANILKSPPYVVAGSPAENDTNKAACVWAEVELSQINNVQTLRINNSRIFSYTNGTPYTSGNIMLGYEDAFDSVGDIHTYVVYDNLRVISLAGPVVVAITKAGGNVNIDFTAGSGDVPAQFVLQSASSVTGPYSDIASTITSLGGSSFRASTPLPASPPAFYRVRRAY